MSIVCYYTLLFDMKSICLSRVRRTRSYLTAFDVEDLTIFFFTFRVRVVLYCCLPDTLCMHDVYYAYYTHDFRVIAFYVCLEKREKHHCNPRAEYTHNMPTYSILTGLSRELIAIKQCVMMQCRCLYYCFPSFISL